MLMAVRSYLQQRGTASLADMANHFHTSADALRGMLGHWERKGCVTCRESASCSIGTCGGGSGCCCCNSAAALEVYEWIG